MRANKEAGKRDRERIRFAQNLKLANSTTWKADELYYMVALTFTL